VIAEIVERVYAAGKPPYQELKDMLLNAPFARSSFKMIKGPPVCGKTTVIAMLVQLCLRAPSVGVVVLAGSNGSTGRLLEILTKRILHDEASGECCEPLCIHK
jgi:ABC-type iron transport system FetAB ATPase subunit